MWSTLTARAKAYYLSIMFTAGGLGYGIFDHTMNSTWGMLTPAGAAVYVIGTPMVGASIGIYAHYSSKWWADERRIRNTAASYKRVRHHLDAPIMRDQYGYLTELDWATVADLEHGQGLTHSSDSQPYCDLSECWKEDQQPDYVVENGFLAIASFPELPGQAPTPSLKKDETGRRLESSIETLNERRAKWGNQSVPVRNDLRNELEARRARGAGYIPASITAEEARNRGYDDRFIQSGSRHTPMLDKLRNMPEEPSRSEEAQHREYERLMKRIEASFKKDGVMVLPHGHHITYRHGGELASIETPSGMIVHLNMDDYRPGQSTIRRRDGEAELFGQALQAMQGYTGLEKKSRPSDSIAYESVKHH